MKNKTKNKLARNTVRVRKKQRAQEGEKTKKKPNKRLIVRVGSIVACMLLVGALVVPCFAAPPPAPDVNLNDALRLAANYVLGVTKINKICRAYLDVYGSGTFFDMGLVNGGDLLKSNVILPIENYIDFSSSSYDGSAENRMYFSTLNYGTQYFYITVDGLETNPALIQCDVEVEIITTSNLSDIAIFVTLFNSITGFVVMEAEYGGYIYDDGDGAKFANLTLDNGFVNLGGNSVGLRVADSVYVGYVGTIPIPACLILDYLFYGYNSPSLSPIDIYEGLVEGALAYNQKSWEEGWDTGFSDGYSYILEQDLYQQGYNDAVSQIETGDFGKNFLGNAFSAPFEGLKQIKLVEWTTADGEYISISVMTVFYATIGIALFIWFLKMFAGG